MTYLQAINAVLRRLREDEVATYTQSAYAKLIGDFVNEAKREIEDAWNWTQLRTTLTVTTAASDDSYTLTGSGERYRILQALNVTQETHLRQVDYTTLNTWKEIGSPTDDSPLYYNVQGSTSGDADIIVYPQPDAIESLNFYMVIPQDDITDGSTEITVPSNLVILGAYAKAISERGEDAGNQFAEALTRYDKAVSDAISIDSANVPNELNWTVN